MSIRIRAAALALSCAVAPAALVAQTVEVASAAPAQAQLLSSGVTTVHGARVADDATTREIYLLALRSGVRQGCRFGAADPVGAALASTKAVAQSAPEAERAGVLAALDSAGAEYRRVGACAVLGGATQLVIVNQFHGAAWHASKPTLFDDQGMTTEDGLTTVTKSVKLGSGFFHHFGAEADYTFTTRGGMLVAGRDRVPVDEKKGADRWAALEREITAQHPTLLVSRVRPEGATGATDVTRWRTVFTNPDTQALEATLSASRDVDGKLWITADYPGLAGR